MREARTGNDQADDKARELVHRTKQVTRRRFIPREKVGMLTANKGNSNCQVVMASDRKGRGTPLPTASGHAIFHGVSHLSPAIRRD